MEERLIDKIMLKEFKVKDATIKTVDIAFMICLWVFAFMIRKELLPIESADYFGFLKEWMMTIRSYGGFSSLAHEISNYTSPYMYIMTLLSYISTNDLYALKMVSIIFDYLASIATFLIIFQMTASVRKSMIGMTLILLSPTVILDGAYWCQCDIIYTTFLLFSFYYFMKDKGSKSALFFAISFAFKLQSVFLLPFYILMWLKKRTVKLRYFLWVPVIYFISVIPAWIAGRSLKELLLIYFDQSSYYPWGTLEYPNVYALLGEVIPDMRHAVEVSGAGTFMTIIILGCLAYYLYDKKINLKDEIIITLVLFTVAITVYSLPHMHERYGFMIDLFAVIYGVQRVKKLPVTCGFVLVSIISYMPYLIAVDIVPIQYVAIGLLSLIIYVGYDLYTQIQESL